MNLTFRVIISLVFISCNDASEEGAIPSDYIECDYINEKVISDKMIATITSAIGGALGNPKFQIITQISQMI